MENSGFSLDDSKLSLAPIEALCLKEVSYNNYDYWEAKAHRCITKYDVGETA